MMEKAGNSDHNWSIQKSMVHAIAMEPVPSMRRLNHEFMEEFGYPPDFDIIDFFIETIKNREQTFKINLQDSTLEFAYEIAKGIKPSVPEFNELFRKKFGTLPSNNVLKYFLTSVKKNHGEAKNNEQYDFSLARTIAEENDPSFGKLCQAYEDIFGKPPTFEIIDYFILNLVKK